MAKRCDICHQSDQFDAQNNLCARCHTVDLSKQAKPDDHTNDGLGNCIMIFTTIMGSFLFGVLPVFAADISPAFLLFGTIFGGLGGAFVGLCFAKLIEEPQRHRE